MIATYAFNFGALDPPVASPAGGIYGSGQQVTLTALAGATIRYTTNGSDPTAASAIYASPITVATGVVTIKARAYHPDWTASEAMVETFAIDVVVPTIAARQFPSPFNGWHLSPVTVQFQCLDNFAVANCSFPITVSVEGAAQSIAGTVTDTVGLQAIVVETLNLDLTPPVLAMTSPEDESVTTDTTIEITGSVSDALSGVASVKCNGVETALVDGQVSCSVALRPGRNTVSLSALDTAGNTASVVVNVSRVGAAPTALALSPAQRRLVVNDQVLERRGRGTFLRSANGP